MKERGSAAVAAVTLGSFALAVGIGVVVAAGLVGARFRAETAADAAALAAVAAGFEPGGDPVAEAARFASLNGASLSACTCPVDLRPRRRVAAVEAVVAVDVPLVGEVAVSAVGLAELLPGQVPRALSREATMSESTVSSSSGSRGA